MLHGWYDLILAEFFILIFLLLFVVTGLPDEIEEHAQFMCQFALEMLEIFDKVTGSIRPILGDSVLDLKLRVGMNSGGVTAGQSICNVIA